jgi:hypothetical protein
MVLGTLEHGFRAFALEIYSQSLGYLVGLPI